MGVIYAGIETSSGKMYVGQHRQPAVVTSANRGAWKARCKKHDAGYSGAKAMHHAVKAGRKFHWIILAHVPLDDLDAQEQHWIAKFKTMAPNGYNIRPGGNQTPFHEETREKLRTSWRSDERRKRQTESWTAFKKSKRYHVANAARASGIRSKTEERRAAILAQLDEPDRSEMQKRFAQFDQSVNRRQLKRAGTPLPTRDEMKRARLERIAASAPERKRVHYERLSATFAAKREAQIAAMDPEDAAKAMRITARNKRQSENKKAGISTKLESAQLRRKRNIEKREQKLANASTPEEAERMKRAWAKNDRRNAKTLKLLAPKPGCA